MGCLDSTPQACKPSYSRTVGQPSCPALCPADGEAPRPHTAGHDDAQSIPAGQRAGDGSNQPVAIPLFVRAQRSVAAGVKVILSSTARCTFCMGITDDIYNISWRRDSDNDFSV